MPCRKSTSCFRRCSLLPPESHFQSANGRRHLEPDGKVEDSQRAAVPAGRAALSNTASKRWWRNLRIVLPVSGQKPLPERLRSQQKVFLRSRDFLRSSNRVEPFISSHWTRGL